MTLLGDATQPLLTATGVLSWDKPDPRSEMPPDLNVAGSGTAATIALASSGPTPGISISRRPISFVVRRVDLAIGLQRCALTSCSWVTSNRRQARAKGGTVVASSTIISISPGAPYGRSAPRAKLRHVPADRVRKPAAGASASGGCDAAPSRSAAPRFSRNKAHGRPAHRLADRLSVGRIVLLAFDVGLHVVGAISRTSCPNARSSRAQ